MCVVHNSLSAFFLLLLPLLLLRPARTLQRQVSHSAHCEACGCSMHGQQRPPCHLLHVQHPVLLLQRREDELLAVQPANIMFDRRVVRGNTYASRILPAEPALLLGSNSSKAQSQAAADAGT